MKLGFIYRPERGPHPERDQFHYSSHIPERRSWQEHRILIQWQHAANINHAVIDWPTEKRNLPFRPDEAYDAFEYEGTKVNAATIKASTFASSDDWVILL